MSEIIVPLYDLTGQQSRTVELPSQVFGLEGHKEAILRALRRQMANKRRGTASSLTRGEVAGGGNKPYLQKGTGRARQGSIRSPLRPGGGVTFGPRPRSFELDMPKKERRMAIFSLLSDKVKNNALFVLNADSLEPKTKNVREALLALGLKAKVLFALVREEGQIAKAAHSIPLLKAVLWQNINVKDLLDCDYLVLSFKALNRIKEVWGQ